jgi:hypothetical protein
MDSNQPVPSPLAAQLLSSLIGLAGIIGLFAHVFKISELLQGIRIGSGCRHASPLHEKRGDNYNHGESGVVSPIVNPMRVITLPGDIEVAATHSKGSVTLHDFASARSSLALTEASSIVEPVRSANSAVQSRRTLPVSVVPV